MRGTSARTLITAAVAVQIVTAPGAWAHDHPTPEQIEQAKQDGTYEARMNRTMQTDPHRLSRGLAQRAAYKVRRASLESANLPPSEVSRRLLSGPAMAFPFTSPRELDSLGTVRTVTVLIDFNDHRAETELPGMDAPRFSANIYGDGTDEAQNHLPYESMNAYYRRASQDQVDVRGDVLDWYHFSQDRDTYEPAEAPPGPDQKYAQAILDNQALFDLAFEALEAYDDEHDFAQYDNDNDGDIDLVTILYTGPNTGWGGFWWAYRWSFFVNDAYTKTLDGKRLKQFVFQFVKTRGLQQNDFNPQTLIHEMGHAFGLADYYDYDAEVGPPGGVGGLDMMAGSWGNHNAFSRWLLDWIDMDVIGDGEPVERTLVASGSSSSAHKAIAVFPGLTATNAPDREMFIVENRTQFGNDAMTAQTPGNGLLIWHVDATVDADATDFEFDNSYSSHKLLRLVRADTPDDFNAGDWATSSSYFQAGDDFTPSSVSPSTGLTGPTNVSVDRISPNGEVMTLDVGFVEEHPDAPHPVAAAAGEPATDFASVAESFAEEMRTPPTPYVNLDDLERYDRKFSTATPNELSRLATSVRPVAAMPDAPNQSAVAYKLLITHWAAKDGPSAIKEVRKLSDRNLRADMLSLALRTWAKNDPHGAFAWYLDDDQAPLRHAADVDLGSEFTRDLFEWYGRVDRPRAIASVGKLTRPADVWGAVSGLRRAADRTGMDADTLGKKLRAVAPNGDFIDAVRRIQETVDEAEDKVNDRAQRLRLREFIQSGVDR